MNELNQLLSTTPHEEQKQAMQKYLYKQEGEKLIGELTIFFIKEAEKEEKRKAIASKPGTANEMMYGQSLVADYQKDFVHRARILKDLLVDVLGITEQGATWSYAFGSPNSQHLASEVLGRYNEILKILTQLVSKL